MDVIKSHTDLDQSKKLAEILPLESADQTWARIAIAGANLDVPEELQYRHNGDMPFQYYSGIGIPCWSLAGLLGIIKNKCGYYELVYLKSTFDRCANRLENVHRLSVDIYDVYKEELIDACVAMVEKLHKLNLL